MRDMSLIPYKALIPLLTQNLKAMRLWVFHFIWCITLSFLPDVRLWLTLGLFLTTSILDVNQFALVFFHDVFLTKFLKKSPNGLVYSSQKSCTWFKRTELRPSKDHCNCIVYNWI